MEPEIIETSVASLPYSELGEIQADHEIWEEQDGGAHIKVTRHRLPTTDQIPIVSMSVSGPKEERERVIAEFISVYGEPAIPIDYSPEVDVVAWLYPPAQ